MTRESVSVLRVFELESLESRQKSLPCGVRPFSDECVLESEREIVNALGSRSAQTTTSGTRPLYTLKEVFAGNYPIPLSQDNGMVILSLILWLLVIIVSIKYVVLVMRADNRAKWASCR